MNLVRQIMRHATQQPRDVRESNSAVTDQLSRVIMKMLAKRPEERYQTPAQVAEALKQVLASLPPPGRG